MTTYLAVILHLNLRPSDGLIPVFPLGLHTQSSLDYLNMSAAAATDYVLVSFDVSQSVLLGGSQTRSENSF